MPAFAYHFGIRPWEVDLLTYRDFENLCAAVEQINKESDG